MARVRDALRNLTSTRYTRSLEAEIARLRAENRALLNSILGIAGVPPITVSTDEAANQGFGDDAVTVGTGSGLDAAGVARLRGIGTRNGTRRAASSGTAPVRRRSWHQINQALEIDSARTKERQLADGPEIGVATKSS